MRICFVDAYYLRAISAFYDADPGLASRYYPEQLAAILARGFGTADFYSRNFSTLGWDCRDVIGNAHTLQSRWWLERYNAPSPADIRDVALAQIAEFSPDVLFVQDLSLLSPAQLSDLRKRGIFLAAQHSCPWAGDDAVRSFDLVFTSFPHYVPRIQALGVQSELVPLAFEHTVRNRAKWGPRDIDIAFVGGVGRGSHWARGMDVLDAVARAYPDQFRWWGYGVDRLDSDSPLRNLYQGEAWGLPMYDAYARAKIVINRHGEVAEGRFNNMRCYEATGMGACLLTDNAEDAHERGIFGPDDIDSYDDPDEAVAQIRWLLDSGLWATIGGRGRERTMNEHTYERRMVDVSESILAAMAKRRTSVAISGGFQRLTSPVQVDILGRRFSRSWETPEMAAKQLALVQREIEAIDHGDFCPPFKAFLDAVASINVVNAEDNPVLVELGCGVGHYSEVVQQYSFPMTYYGGDSSSAMIEAARSSDFGECVDRHLWFKVFDLLDGRFLADPTETIVRAFDLRRVPDILVEGCAILHIADWEPVVRALAAVGSPWLVFHRLPWIGGRENEYWRKEAYGVPCLEVHFGVEAFIELLNDLEYDLHAAFPVSVGADFGSTTHVFRRRT